MDVASVLEASPLPVELGGLLGGPFGVLINEHVPEEIRVCRIGSMPTSDEKTRTNLIRTFTRMRGVWRREGKRALARRILGQFLPPNYKRWIAKNEPTPSALARQRAAAEGFPLKPRITVLMRVGTVGPHLLDASIRSVARQSYDRLELYLVDDRFGPTPATSFLDAWAATDPRIHRTRVENQQGPIDAAIPPEIRGSEFITVLSPGDILAANALFEVVQLVNRHPEAALIYFDEDSLSENGKTRMAPFFKPDWSPEMLLSVNYLAHAVIRRTLLEEAGTFADLLKGAGGWDIALRCTERTREIYHIPKVLYHCRHPRGSSGERWDRPGVSDDLRYVEAHCRRLGLADARAAFVSPGVVRVTWRPSGSRVSIIIPNKNHAHILRRCIASITERTSYTNFEILIVDTGSTDRATLDYYGSLASDPRIRIVDHPGKFNYSATNNAGVRLASGSMLLFLNNDTEALESDWLEEMVRWAERPTVGAVAPKLLYPEGHIAHAGIVFGLYGLTGLIYRYVDENHADVFGSVDWYRNYLAVTGACMMMRRSVFEEVGGFDEAYEVAFSDVEICLRIIQRGRRIVYTPFARLLHLEGATRGQYVPVADIRRALTHMKGVVESGDPYFNPNLSYESAIPSLPQWMDRPRAGLLSRLIRRTGMS